MPELSEVEKAVRNYRSLLLARDASLSQSLTSRYAAIQKRLEGEIKATAEQIAKAAADGPVTAQLLMRMDRYQALLADLNAATAEYSRWAQSLIEQEQRTDLQLGLEAGRDLVESAYHDAGRTVAAFNVLPVDAVGYAVGYTQPGTPFYQLIHGAFPAMTEQVTAAIVAGLATGDPLRDIGRVIYGLINDNLNMPLYRALMIARTETLRAYRSANQAQMGQAGVTRYIRRCALNPRTCPACLALDGKIYPIDTNFQIHPNDRCFMAPLLPGIDMSKFQTGRDWFMAQSEATQLQIVGPGKLEWLKAGGDFEKLASIHENKTWGKTVGNTPLKDLLK